MIVLITDLNKGVAYFTNNIDECVDFIDKDLFNLTHQHNETITIGKSFATPETYFSKSDKQDLEEYGLNKFFDI